MMSTQNEQKPDGPLSPMRVEPCVMWTVNRNQVQKDRGPFSLPCSPGSRPRPVGCRGPGWGRGSGHSLPGWWQAAWSRRRSYLDTWTGEPGDMAGRWLWLGGLKKGYNLTHSQTKHSSALNSFISFIWQFKCHCERMIWKVQLTEFFNQWSAISFVVILVAGTWLVENYLIKIGSEMLRSHIFEPDFRWQQYWRQWRTTLEQVCEYQVRDCITILSVVLDLFCVISMVNKHNHK